MSSPNQEPESSPPPAFRSSSTARVAITLAFVIFILGGFVACHCPEIFIVVAICALVALWAGSRRQRIVAAILLVISIAVAIAEFRAESEQEQRRRDRTRRIIQANQNLEQSDTEKKPNKPEMATPNQPPD